MLQYTIDALNILTLLREKSRTARNYTLLHEVMNVIDMKEEVDIILADLLYNDEISVINTSAGKVYSIKDKGLLRLRDAYKELTPQPPPKPQVEQVIQTVHVRENYGTIGHSSGNMSRNNKSDNEKPKTNVKRTIINTIIGILSAVFVGWVLWKMGWV
jgi:hypothetical protein